MSIITAPFGDHAAIRQAEAANAAFTRAIHLGYSTVASRHFATFPPALIEPCILAGCPEGGTVLDPFGGAGTTGLVATQAGRGAVLCEINPEYVEMARTRIEAQCAPIDPPAGDDLHHPSGRPLTYDELSGGF